VDEGYGSSFHDTHILQNIFGAGHYGCLYKYMYDKMSSVMEKVYSTARFERISDILHRECNFVQIQDFNHFLQLSSL